VTGEIDPGIRFKGRLPVLGYSKSWFQAILVWRVTGKTMSSELVQIGHPPTQKNPSLGSLSAADFAPAPAIGPRGKTFYIETFGCQMNVHDSEKVAGALVARGYRAVDTHETADIILYNTCSIREKAAHKVYSRLGAFRKAGWSKNKIIGVLGCLAQQEGGQFFERAPEVSLVCGSASYPRLPDLLQQVESGERRVTGLNLETEDCFETELTRRESRFRAYLTIIEGCDQRCAFCVVPMTRGPERSRSGARIIEECHRLVDAGYTEIQILGQIVNAWRDPAAAKWSFAELLTRVAAVPGLRRVRFTTSHPRYFTPDIVEAIDSNPVLCDQIHLPVQTGSTALLKTMFRGYSRDEYLEKIQFVKKARRAISLSTDMIVGFCGESERDFEDTLSLLHEVAYDQVFAFTFSPRPNTIALGYADTVPEEEKKRRLTLLQEVQRQIQLRNNQASVGHDYEVLVEGYQPRLGQAAGRTTTNKVVNFPGTPADVGNYRQVRVESAGPNSLVGSLVELVHRDIVPIGN
jgi:tRNA-2-methylthio-N6-dimethylallyladenosine synthase